MEPIEREDRRLLADYLASAPEVSFALSVSRPKARRAPGPRWTWRSVARGVGSSSNFAEVVSMHLTDQERQNIRDSWQKKRIQAIEREKNLKKEALVRVQKIARFLQDKYSISRVYLYGSLARNGHFDIHSDIDLLITGWNEDQNYWKMLAQASELARPYQVSIITEKEASPSLRETIQKEGRLLG